MEMAKLLVDKGAEVDARDCYRNTPLYIAVRDDYDPEIIRFLLKNEADINAENYHKLTPLFLHAPASFKKNS